MSCVDPISDMLTRVRNAYQSKHTEMEVPFSRMKGEIARILKREGYVLDYGVEGGSGAGKVLRMILKYGSDGCPAIRGLQRKSRSGLRVYVGCDDLPLVLGGMGTAIVTTSAGVMTGREARKRRIGGELLCTIW